MAIFIVSDLHLGHSKDFIYSARGFENVEDMNETIIRKWNEVVDEEDDVYVGRSYKDAPNVDGYVFINTDITSLMSGDIVSVYIEGSTEYDLIGRLV